MSGDELEQWLVQEAVMAAYHMERREFDRRQRAVEEAREAARARLQEHLGGRG